MRLSVLRTSILAAALAATVLGCDEEEDLALPEVPGPPRDTPTRLIAAYFAQSYAGQDSAAYADMLDEAFEFVFLESDRDSAELDSSGVSWSRDSELRSAGAMFRAPRVLAVVLELTPVTDPVAVNDYLPDQPAGETWYRVITDTDLRVTVADPEGIDDTIFTVTNQQEFIIRPDLRSGHEGEWRLRAHRELDALGRASSRASGVEPSSWGSVKTLFN